MANAREREGWSPTWSTYKSFLNALVWDETTRRKVSRRRRETSTTSAEMAAALTGEQRVFPRMNANESASPTSPGSLKCPRQRNLFQLLTNHPACRWAKSSLSASGRVKARDWAQKKSNDWERCAAVAVFTEERTAVSCLLSKQTLWGSFHWRQSSCELLHSVLITWHPEHQEQLVSPGSSAILRWWPARLLWWIFNFNIFQWQHVSPSQTTKNLFSFLYLFESVSCKNQILKLTPCDVPKFTYNISGRYLL